MNVTGKLPRIWLPDGVPPIRMDFEEVSSPSGEAPNKYFQTAVSYQFIVLSWKC